MKWLVLVNKSHDFDSNEPDYDVVINICETKKEAKEIINNYHLGGYENYIYMLEGKRKK